MRSPGWGVFLIRIVIALILVISVISTPVTVKAARPIPGPFPTSAPFAAGTTELDPVVNQGGIDPRVQVDPQFERCDGNCLLNKANENITLQIRYILQKYYYLEDDQNSEDNKRKVLSGFCGNLEETDDCIGRWKEVNRFWILKARGALSKNENSIAQLAGVQCTGTDCKTLIAAPAFQPGIPLAKTAGSTASPTGANGDPAKPQFAPAKLSQAPYFSRAQELAQQAAKLQSVTDSGVGASNMNNSNNEEWARSMADQLKPNQEDFVRFKTILRDPLYPQAGTMEVPVMTADGKALDYDQEAYNLAMRKYRETFGYLAENSGSASSTWLAETVANPSIRDQISQNRREMIQDFKMPTAAVSESGPQPLRVVFEKARNFYVGEVNQMLWGTSASLNYTSQKAAVVHPQGATGQTNLGPTLSSQEISYPMSSRTQDAQGNWQQENVTYSVALSGSQFTFAPVGQPQGTSNGFQVVNTPPKTPPSSTPPNGVVPNPVSSGPSTAVPSASSPLAGSTPAVSGTAPSGAPSLNDLSNVSDPGALELDFN